MVELLAKPDTGLIDHLVEVARLGAQVADRLGLSGPLWTKAVLACALHDIGKATTDFQEYIRGRSKKAYPHALASLPFVLMVETCLAQRYGWETRCLEATAAVLTHHSPLSPHLYKGWEVPAYHPNASRALREIFQLLASWNIQGLPRDDREIEVFWQKLQPWLRNSPAALLDAPVGGEGHSLRGLLQRLPPQDFAQVKAILHLADWLASARRPQPTVLFLSHGGQAVEWHVQALGRPLRMFQEKAREASSRAPILWLRAPTGTGKTEALLLWAGAAERLIYLLPTQATTNAIWRRLCKIYDADAVGLAHGHAAYVLRRESDEDPLDFRLFGSVFAKPVTVATLDQYLLAHLHGRHWEERRSLARKATVIIDEIHAYEPYTLGLLLEALEREKPARLALASATLPRALLQLFPEGYEVEAEDSLWARKRYRLELRKGSLQDALEEAVALARQNKKVLIVANTVPDAQALYRRLRDEFRWERRHVLHARFTLRGRQQREAQVEKPEPGTIFIATQVVEVSLDISYDMLFTEIAPLDALVQRMGRVNRMGQGPPASVIVYCGASPGAQRIYGTEILERSEDLLKGLGEMPTDRELAEATHRFYEPTVSSQEWQQELREGRQTLDEVQRVLGCYTIDLSDEEMRQRFTARRGQVSVEVLPSQFITEAYELKEKGETWRGAELMVPVPAWWLRYTEFFTPVEDLRCMQTTLEYDPELGLIAPTAEQTYPTSVMLVE